MRLRKAIWLLATLPLMAAADENENNGAPAEYNANEPYADVDLVSGVANLLPGNLAAALQKAGVLGFLNMMFRIMLSLLRNLKTMIHV